MVLDTRKSFFKQWLQFDTWFIIKICLKTRKRLLQNAVTLIQNAMILLMGQLLPNTIFITKCIGTL